MGLRRDGDRLRVGSLVQLWRLEDMLREGELAMGLSMRASCRARREHGGVIIEVASGRIVTDELSMPHSPRLVDGKLCALDFGRGQIIAIDPETGRREDIAFCPGFLRGLAVHNGHALVTASKPRDGSFKELALQSEIEKRDRS